MEEYALKSNDIDEDNAKVYTKLSIPPNQHQCICVRVKLPNNKILTTYFALWDTILQLKHYILPELQPKVKNIQQIECIVYDEYHMFEVNDHSLLKNYWNKLSINVFIRIINQEDIKTASLDCMLNDKKCRYHLFHPERGNVLETNLIMPIHALGFRNKKNGKLYKNTTVQTVPENIDGQNIENTRTLTIQTTETQNVGTEGVIECGTQTESIIGFRRLNVLKELTTYGRTISDDSNPMEELHKYARLIQKSVRIWLNRIKFQRMLRYYNYLKQLTCNTEKTMKHFIYTRQKQALINLQYPTKTKDFEALYSEIHSHYKNKRQTNKNSKINFNEKLKCLREIMKHKNEINKITKEKKIFRKLKEISKPITMTRKNGEKMFIETPETRTAQQFMGLYTNLKRNDFSKNERIELILRLQDVLKRFKEIDLTKNIINLLNREITMLNQIQLKNCQLETLRKLIEIEFERILIQPEIIPAVKRSLEPVNLYKCYNCRKLKSLNRFVVNFHLTKTIKCKDCRHLYRIELDHINLTPYADILKDIKASEMELVAKSSLTLFLHVEDIYYLVHIIWNGKSAISEFTDLTQLRMVRWCNKLEWSPTNTILLTIEEAYVHANIHDVNEVFASEFMERIRVKHLKAKKYFSGLIQKSKECDRNIKIMNHNSLET